MRRARIVPVVAGLFLAAALGLIRDAAGDFEVTGPDGRRILLKDDKTWRYVEPEGGEKPDGHALVTVDRKDQLTGPCRFWLRMVNNLPYEIHSLIPQFTAYKTNDVLYQTVFMAITRLRPTDSQERSIQFTLPCDEIERLQISGGDRCEMGDLGRFSDAKGQCLARVKIGESPVVRLSR